MASIEKIARPKTIQEFRKALAVLVFDHFGEHGTVDPCDEIIEVHSNDFRALIAVIDHDRHEGCAFHVEQLFGDTADPAPRGMDRPGIGMFAASLN